METKIIQSKNGFKHTKETKLKISITRKINYSKGKWTPWNKGIERTDETKKKISNTKKNLYAKGLIIPWNKGKAWNTEVKNKLKKSAKKGKNHPNWKGGYWDKKYQNEYVKNWCKKNRILLKNKLFDLLGKKCQKCGFDDIRALQFDHINGQGGKDYIRLSGKRSATAGYYKYYVEHPEEAKKNLQVLCANCNWIKRTENNETKTCGKKANI
jgi:hypothetical protein